MSWKLKNSIGGGKMGLKLKLTVFSTVLMMILLAFSIVPVSGADTGTRSAPMLYQPGVSPLTGNESTVFQFSVWYVDSDGDNASSSYVVIDNAYYTMQTNGTDPTRGVEYTFSTKLPAGNHEYYFDFVNVKNESVKNPSDGTKYKLPVDPGPEEKMMLFNPMMTPARPFENQMINFTVDYTDPLDEELKYIQLIIKPMDTTLVIYTYNMSVPGTNYSQKVSCYYELKLKSGNYTYHFYALTKNQTTRDTSTDPVLFYVSPVPNYPFLANGYVTPTSGKENTTVFNYYVIYDDGNTSYAKIANVVVDGKSYKMTIQNTNTNSGNYYGYSTTLLKGDHTFYFMFSDGNKNITLPSSGVYKGPIVTDQGNTTNGAPSVTLTVTPVSGNVNTTFTFLASGSDPDRDVLTYTWSFSDGTNVTGKTSVSHKFAKPGNYSVTVTVTDPGKLSASASVTLYVAPASQPGRNNPPVIRTNLKPFQIITINTTLYITAQGTYDPDNDPLTYNWTVISPQSNLPAMYTSLSFNYTFRMSVNYTINLEVSDSQVSSKAKYSINVVDSNKRSPPVAKPTVTVNGMLASFSGKGSSDADGYIVSYIWTVENKNYNGMYYNHTYASQGYKTAKLTVKDNDGLTGSRLIGFYISNRSGGGNNDNRNYSRTNVLGHVKVAETDGGEPSFAVINSEPDFIMRLLESRRNYLLFELEAEAESGRLLVVDLVNVFENSVLDKIEVKLDDESIAETELDNILDADGNEPYYCIVNEQGYYQLLVYIDHFSQHTLEISADIGDTPDPTPNPKGGVVNTFLIGGIITVIAVVFIISAMFQVKKKKRLEYYSDFRVAEETVVNGTRSKNDESEVDWDEYL